MLSPCSQSIIIIIIDDNAASFALDLNYRARQSKVTQVLETDLRAYT